MFSHRRRVSLLGLTALVAASASTAYANCASPVNAIEAENCKAGSPKSVWDVGGNGDLSIQGFATDISYNLGATVQFKINTNASAYTIDIYRLGYYAGAGARKVASIVPSATLPQTQPACATNTTVGLSGSGLADCGNWAVSASWPIPPDAVSGVYIALLTRPDTGGRSQIIFVVRDESSHSAVLYQTSDIDWQAYNYYGMGSLYGPANPPGIDLTKRAYKVSYNRPLLSRAAPMNNGLFVTEYPMIRWLEANAYDVSYFSGIDTDRLGTLLPNHQLFLSVGHDEYWSGNQRANVEAARGAGVNLAFFTGNTMFWKVRFENSIDGTNTAYRTLTCYKETQANAVIDSQDPPTWTGTWRDTRFSPPADGGRPENALTGTLYMVNGPQYPGLSMQVPAADGKMRFWRNTTLATQSPGQVTTLPAGSLGYEWDIDADNGFRPAGLVPLSTATYSLSGNFLLDYGSTYGNGIATHHATLYRAPSGALVFGAGTINWTQGLDDVHDTPFPSFPADIRFQQATLNLFADMGVQPGAIQASLIPASRSTDLTPPTSAITSPSAGATVTVGIPVTVSGTATDAGGGVVGAVEVSTDGGATWHPAAGRESWTYTWTPPSASSATIRTRAADDSGNIESPGSGITVSIQARSCPCSVFGTPTPSTPDGQDGNAVELGVKFRSDVSGFITGVRFYKASTNTGTHVGHLWTRDGILLATATFTGETASGWQQVTFPNAVAVSPGVTYVASYLAPVGHYSYDDLFFAVSAADNPPLHALKDGTDGGNGVFAYGPSGAFPVSSYRSRAYGVDVVFVTTVGGASGPSVTTFSPASGATGVARTAPVTITFNKALAAATVTASRFQLLDATLSPMTVNLSYNAATFTVTMVPSFGLDYGAIYTVSVAGGAGGVQDTSGNPMTASISWKFTATAAPPGSCPCTVWPSTAVPATADSGDSGAYEIGVRFRSDAAGFITGLRFFKSAANTGTHVGHLWGRDGTLLGTATFSGESASGWQQVNFASAVAIAANTTYVASYSDPAGHYSIDDLAFATSAVNTAPLHLLQDGTDGANGAFGNLGSFPSTGYRSRNYWVDVVFTTDVGGVFGPNVTAVTPASGAAGLGPATVVSATFSKPLNPASVTSATFGLFDSANNPVPGSLAYDAGTATVTFTPAAGLAPATSYRAAIAGGLGGITDSSGNPVRTGVAWRFSTCCAIWNSSYLPTFTDAGDATPLELGVKFRSDTAGFITGLRFYKSAANTGTHTGHLWGRDGTPLASSTFTGETASGWQQASFSSAVAIAAGTTYVISYTAPAGHYSMDDLYFAAAAADNPPLHALKDGADGVNAVFGSPGAFPTSSYRSRNYWVDAIFMNTVGGAGGPNVTAISPASSSTGVSPVASVTATFSKSLNPSSISGSTFQVFDSSQVLVPAGVTYNDSTKTATLVPSFGLTYGATYTVVLTGGSSGSKTRQAMPWRPALRGSSARPRLRREAVPARSGVPRRRRTPSIPATARRSSWASASMPTSTDSSARCGSIRARPIPEPTWRISGPPAACCWRPPRSPARPPPDGSRRPSPPPSALPPARTISRPTARPPGITRWTTSSLRPRAWIMRRCTPHRMPRAGRTDCMPWRGRRISEQHL